MASSSVPPDSNKRPVACVFCGSSSGTSPSHLAAARSLAHALHANSYTLVYGGGTYGLMGELARTFVSLSGPSSVHGIIPSALLRHEANYTENNAPMAPGSDTATAGPKDAEPSVAGTKSSEIGGQGTIPASPFGKTTVVKDMHERKKKMADEVRAGGPGSGFIALSGGYGTFEELMEMTTWNQLGLHDTGVVVYNIEGYWDGLLVWLKKAVEQGFVREENAGILMDGKDAEGVIRCLREYTSSKGRLNLQWGEK